MMEKPARQPSVIKLTAIPYNRLSAAVGTVADRTWEPYRRAVTNRCAEWMLNYRRAPRQGQALRREKRNVNLNTSNPAMSAAACCAALLTFCLGLVAAHPAAAAPQTSSAPAAETISDEDMDPGLDDSFNIADLRPQYKACIDASDAVMPKVQACQEQEFVYQRGRMRAALARIDAGPDSYFKDEIGNWQHIYMQSTDISCTNLEERGPASEGLSCRINRYANRARALEGLADMADKAYAKGN